MRHFVIESTYLVPFDQLGDNIALHRAFLQTGYDRGLLLCSGPQSSRKGGLIVARAESPDAIQQFMAGDPYQQKGLASYRYVEFEPVKRQAFLEKWIAG